MRPNKSTTRTQRQLAIVYYEAIVAALRQELARGNKAAVGERRLELALWWHNPQPLLSA
jgi:hypothetical protein